MSQQSHALLRLSVAAAAAITQRRFVDFAGNQISAQGARALGVAWAPAINPGDQVQLDVIGTTIVETGGAFSAGTALISDAQGRAISNTGNLSIVAGATAMTSTAANGSAILTGSGLPEAVLASALQASTAAGQFVEVLLHAR